MLFVNTFFGLRYSVTPQRGGTPYLVGGELLNLNQKKTLTMIDLSKKYCSKTSTVLFCFGSLNSKWY